MAGEFSQIFDPATLRYILDDPSRLALYANVAFIALIIKIVFLTVTFVYLIVALTVFVQIGRLENWLMSLRRYHFRRLALIHLVLVSFGWLLALIIL